MKNALSDNWFAAISYLGVLFLLPLLLKRDSEFVQFHARQGVAVFIAWIIIFVVGIVPILGWLFFFFGSIILCVLSLLGILKSLAGERWGMPLLGGFAQKLRL